MPEDERRAMVRHTERAAVLLCVLAAFVLHAAAREIPAELPDPDGKAPDTSKPVKVYILAGQSNWKTRPARADDWRQGSQTMASEPTDHDA